MVKRILRQLLIAALICAFAATPVLAVDIEQVQAEMPGIDVYLYMTDEEYNSLTTDKITGTLDGNILKTEELGPTYHFSKGIFYVYMLDISGSMQPQAFSAAKQSILNAQFYLAENDRLALITFGDDVTDVFTNLRAGSEDRAKLEAVLAELEPTNMHTSLYGAIQHAISLTKSENDMRNIGILITDGMDDTQVGLTRQELEQQLNAAGISLYALCEEQKSTQETRDELGAMARGTGGSISVFNAQNAWDQLDAVLQHLRTCLLLRLSAATNHADGALHELNLRFGDIAMTSNAIVTDQWVPDNISPTMTGANYDSGTGAIRLTFSEAVSDGENPAHYDLKGESGEHIALSSVRYRGDDRTVVDLFPQTVPFEGKYTLTVSGLKDISMEENLMQPANRTLTLATGVFPEEEPEEAFRIPWWFYIAAAVLLAAILLLLILLLRKKRQEEDDTKLIGTITKRYKYKIRGGQGIKLLVSINDGCGTVTQARLTLVSSLIFGRSKMSDVYFDYDAEMSKQHCVLEYDNGVLMLTDLQSLNGTLVNGIPIHAPRPIHVGDSFEIGHTTVKLLQIDTKSANGM